ncbi:MAG TPA: hypothetical protein VK485_11420 [Sphingomicrobium sp.]|nr:hypothetical protein [Sphingomicrobium sp.]
MANKTANLPWYSLAVGLIVIIAFGWLCYFMIEKSQVLGPNEQFRWDRLLLIFNSVQAMAAAALGVMLGTAVQQGKVDTAEASAAKAEADAKANQSEANKAENARKLINSLQPPGAGAGAADQTIAHLKTILN